MGGVCAFALSDLGCVYCFGGSLAGVSNDQQPSTIPSSALSNVVSIAAGYGHALALTKNGGVVAWGLNTSGETQVPDRAKSNVISIAAGNRTSAALTASGEVLVWGAGNNYYGTLNIPDNAKSGIVQIAVDDHVLALRNDGTVISWGANYVGQSSIPSGLSNVVTISAASGSSVALTLDGRVVSWGNAGFFQSPTPSNIANSDYVAAGAGYSVNWAINTYKPLYTNGLGYSMNSNSITILGYNGSNSIVTIPSKINGLPVTFIEDNAFANQSNITTITIPDSVVTFGTNVFGNSPNLVINGSQSMVSYLASNASVLGFTGNALTSIQNGGIASGSYGWIANWLLSDSSFLKSLSSSLQIPSLLSSLSNSIASVAAQTSPTNPTFISAVAAQILAGTNNYGIAVKQNQSLNFPAIPTLTITPSKKFTNTVTASSGLSVTQASDNTVVATVSNNVLTLIGAGSTTITANQPGNALWNPVTASQPLIVIKGVQTLSFTAIAAQTYAANKKVTLSSSSSAKLTNTSYLIDNGAVGSISNNVVTLLGTGTATITATNSGNTYFAPAFAIRQLIVK